jgi:hypothetical protein
LLLNAVKLLTPIVHRVHVGHFYFYGDYCLPLSPFLATYVSFYVDLQLCLSRLGVLSFLVNHSDISMWQLLEDWYPVNLLEH